MIIIKKVKKFKWYNKNYTTYAYKIISKKHNITYEFDKNKTFKEVIKHHMIDKNRLPVF